MPTLSHPFRLQRQTKLFRILDERLRHIDLILCCEYYASHSIRRESSLLKDRDTVMRIERELMRGAGPVAVLKLLEEGPKYGYEMVAALARHADGVLDMGQATLYPMLYNMESQGFIAAEWSPGSTGRQRKYYKLTASGKKRLADSQQQWRALADAFHGMGILTGGASCSHLEGATP